MDPDLNPGPWTLDPDPDPEKPVLWKTWALKNLDPEKTGINKYRIKKYVWL